MTKQEICELAEQIASTYNPYGLSPFPYEKITDEKKDLHIILSETAEGISGATVYLKASNEFSIIINKNKPKTRQNFTIAHELGHYFLHKEIIKSEEVLVDGDNSLDNNILFRLDAAETSMVETEANNFAAALIMPESLVRKAWEDLADIEEMASVFKVSPSAMSIRLEKLGIIE